MKRLEMLVIAIWSGFIFGILEGLVFNFTRQFPALFAPYKLPAEVLWVSPIINIVVFSFTILLLSSAIRAIAPRVNMSHGLLTLGVGLFLGLFGVLNAPKVLHLLSTVLLAGGLTIVIVRVLRRHEQAVIHTSNRFLLIIPLSLILLALGVYGTKTIYESQLYNDLPVAWEDSPNVLLIVMDTVRFDRFSIPTEPLLTPNLVDFANAGMRFTNAWPTTSWTLPSHASILTGYYPHQHGADWPELNLDPQTLTLGEYFRGRGYVTAAFSGNSSWVTPEYLGSGFMRFQVYILADLMRRTSYGRILNRVSEWFGYHYAGLGKKAPQSNIEFLDFIDDYPDRPFFVLINYMDVNQAFYHEKLNRPFWEFPAPVEDQIAAYDEGLRQLDSQIGELFQELSRRGTLSNMLIVITSDHGQSFGASALHDHDPSGHGTSLYVEQLHVPLFIIYPEKILAGSSNEALVSLHQLPATLALLSGDKSNPFPGAALVGNPMEIANPGVEQESEILASLNYGDSNIRSILWDQYQYIKNILKIGTVEELFDLESDPFAQNNIVKEFPSLESVRKSLQVLLGMEER